MLRQRNNEVVLNEETPERPSNGTGRRQVKRERAINRGVMEEHDSISSPGTDE